ncbi:bifunctional transcriptional activator/DNA repair enzyme AdaA [Paenibacillus hamazuiensis]|uniref:bifunctional transcriptional activator/DNA repair enzyme AdaA n=1 Tax=Paenibacillus hamazuiensis TaxID=2936508 RepID=UPI00200BA340|nr:bifunctional transcriptional activator/DNA repair enzyme AdaA [Paenibacillus hamazuiensis]
METINDEMWRAIVENDASYDGKFYYAVKTTGIVCRPSCKSRIPNKEHVRIFADVRQALKEQFRPCKRCKPGGELLPDEEWVQQMVRWIDEHFAENITLQLLADHFHSSPYHLHRTFKRIRGVTPAEYILQVRMRQAKRELRTTDKTVTDIAASVGIPSAAHFATLFQKTAGCTPTQYRRTSRESGGSAEGGILS